MTNIILITEFLELFASRLNEMHSTKTLITGTTNRPVNMDPYRFM